MIIERAKPRPMVAALLEIHAAVVDIPLEDQHADGAEEEPFPELLAGGLLALLGLDFLVADVDLLGGCEVALAGIEQVDGKLLRNLAARAFADFIDAQVIG